MATVGELARTHYRQQQTLTRNVARALDLVWSTLTPSDLEGSWSAVSARAAGLVAAGQYAASANSVAYIGSALEAQSLDPTPLAPIDPRGLTGTAADGRALDSLLTGGIYRTKALIASGAPLSDALTSGRLRMMLAGTNEVTQAGISGASAQIGVTPTAAYWVRQLQTPSCSRCIVLAGKVFTHNEGFRRHPRCDCIHVPGARRDLPTTSPSTAFNSMSHAEQDATFTQAGAEALRAGADMGRVVNARQSTYVPTDRRNPRGTPTTRTVEDCLARAGTDRNALVDLLDRAGYLRPF